MIATDPSRPDFRNNLGDGTEDQETGEDATTQMIVLDQLIGFLGGIE